MWNRNLFIGVGFALEISSSPFSYMTSDMVTTHGKAVKIKIENMCKVIRDWYILRIQTMAYFLTFYGVLLVELTDYVETFTSLVLHRSNCMYLYSPESSFPIK